MPLLSSGLKENERTFFSQTGEEEGGAVAGAGLFAEKELCAASLRVGSAVLNTCGCVAPQPQAFTIINIIKNTTINRFILPR